MELEDVLEGLRGERGAHRVEVLPDDVFEEVVAEERKVTAVGGSMPVIQTGMEECRRRSTRVCVFCEVSFKLDDCVSMRMVDEAGNVVGHDIPRKDALRYMKMDNVVFISEDFIVYSDAPMQGSTAMEMLARPYTGTGGWLPKEMGAVIWFPATTSSDIIRRHFGEMSSDYATGIVALDL